MFTAASFEYNLLKKAVSSPSPVSNAGISCMSGRIGGKRILLIKTGIGPANAQKAYAGINRKDFKIDSIVNIGAGGALNPDYLTGDVAMACRVAGENDGEEYAAESTEIKPYNFSFRLHLKSKLVSAGRPVNSRERREYYRRRYSADVVDMEAAALIKGAYTQGIPCCIIKGISDRADDLINIPENIITPRGRISYPEVISLFMRSPFESAKSLACIYRNSRLAVGNAARFLEGAVCML